MNRDRVRALLHAVRQGDLDPEEALESFARLPFVDVPDARVDTHRALRHGLPEVVYAPGKTAEQIAAVVRTLGEAGQDALVTRVEPGLAAELRRAIADAGYDARARLLWTGPDPVPVVGKGTIAVVCAGTADVPVAAEAALVARRFGNRVESLFDVGVAGLHRLLASSEVLRSARVLVVVAGMEGALPSVVGGLVDKPVIAVPTSVGYGASFGGVAALLGMLTSCASNVSVVNIDNGFGAAYVATLINRLSARGGRVLHLDCFSGIAGNMFLGALLDLGLPRRELEADLGGLGVAHRLRVSRVRRGPIAARYVEVLVPGGPRRTRDGHAHADHAHADHAHADHTHADHAHADHTHADHAHAGHAHADRERGGDRARGGTRRQRAGHGRSYGEVRRIVERARVDPAVRRRALAVFEALGRAEARVHGIALEKVHFHEVGAVDAIVDVVGAAIGLERLGVVKVTASPVALGSGQVESDHGRLPLPAPAALELLRGVPTVPAHVPWETVTPTGAAILHALAEEFGELPAMVIESIGHGAGDDRPGPMPNVLRAVLGRQGGAHADRVALLETNLDDLVPEHFDHLMERLFAAGALDVSLQHLQMKKNRPGILVRVIARPSDRMALARVLFAESTAIGVRASESERIVLEREEVRVQTRFGAIRVKRVFDPQGRPSVSAEVDDCKRAAVRAGVPLRDVIRAAEEAAREGG